MPLQHLQLFVLEADEGAGVIDFLIGTAGCGRSGSGAGRLPTPAQRAEHLLDQAGKFRRGNRVV